MKRLSSRARRLTAALALAAAGAGVTAATALTTIGSDHAVAYPHFACVGVGSIGICIGPPGS